MASRHSTVSGVMGQCICAGCSGPLVSPVQLTECLHILCNKCALKLKRNSGSNTIFCPKCNTENNDLLTLQLIAGISSNSSDDVIMCDRCMKDAAMWNCFNCSMNLCGNCRTHHEEQATDETGDIALDQKKHSYMLLPQASNLRGKIFDSSFREINEEEDAAAAFDSLDASDTRCPVCNEDRANCRHTVILQSLQNEALPPTHCPKAGHAEYAFFCLKCWVPCCGECSEKGEHKLHETRPLEDMGTYLEDSMNKVKERASALMQGCVEDVKEEEAIEQRLKKHVDMIGKSMEERRLKILKQTTISFDQAVANARGQGQDILTDYRGKLAESQRFNYFLDNLRDTLSNISLDRNHFSVANSIQVFEKQKEASSLLAEVDGAMRNLTKAEERRLVLPEVKKVVPPPLPLARVGTEWSSLKLAFSLPLGDRVSIPLSIVVTGSEECLISAKMSKERDPDGIIYYHQKTGPFVHDTPRGRFMISQLKSKEIVASYSNPDTEEHGVMYSNGHFLSSPSLGNNVQFDEVKRFDFPPTGITTTSDNYILVCVLADSEKVKHLSCLMKMSLRGEVIKTTMRRPGRNMISPDFVAVNDDGDICVADTEGSSVIVLNENLDIKDRMNYRLPTMMDESSSVFKPHGLCYDSYGRIIVTDPDNQSVVRLVRDPNTLKYIMQPLLTKSDDLPGLSYPRLVAMGPDMRLWVVCRNDILVFDYCT
ncbi:uncharacterized protein LOC101850399 [Aplysia californica]|uniref:Uncharacterized protein LOC101850399 n=1 Tax=Aplysia californica TaxID=6500 RepID=A0ABM0JFD0_APLCA|nr:uncharacterized protein LOC101850399 [Aplysia californica]